ncbi:MAG TPA: ferrous iron transport protein B, partial [Desulfobaccales bacterium]|nr:ferrous iron transport protein B [Desulfobaccales bacterium]
MKIALIGQPNCGKSTIFNYFSGYKAAVSNFPGTTVKYTISRVVFEGEELTCVDLPGVYSLTSIDPAERESRNYLLAGNSDVIINVLDASMLSRSLELTIELMSLERPLVVALNMMDEAARKGITIDAGHLSELLGVPVVATVAAAGRGLSPLLRAAVSAGQAGIRPVQTQFSRDVEEEIDALADRLDFSMAQKLAMPWRFMLVKAMEDDPYVIEEIGHQDGGAIPWVQNSQKILAQTHGRPPETVISSERHALSLNLFEQVAQVQPAAKPDWRERLDKIATHKFWGYILLLAVMAVFFLVVFQVGQHVENFLMGYLTAAQGLGRAWLGTHNLAYSVLDGLLMGIFGGIAIVLPYLVPFLLGLALLEDSGYLPRVAFLMDNLMHFLGLHGKSIVPFILGYGCSVPAVMATRILESPRDRLIVSMLAVLVPCSARSVIIFALVAYALGPWWALGVYFFNLVVIAVLGKVSTWVLPEASPG